MFGSRVLHSLPADSALRRLRYGAGFWLPLAAASLVSACGGGGGGAATPSATEQQQSAGGSSGSTVPPVVTPPTFDASSANGFHFEAAPQYASVASFEADTGGSVYSAWSPSGPAKLSSTGAKILFFGVGAGCAAGTHDGTDLQIGGAQALAEAASYGLSAATSASVWMPSGATAGCDASQKDVSGLSQVALVSGPDDGVSNTLAMRTSTGPGTTAKPSFLQQFPSTGQDGAGLNAFITNSTVSFRQAFPTGSLRRPWVDSGEMLMHAQQAVSATPMPAHLNAGELVQSRQQLMATFVNGPCWANSATLGHPCQVQVIFDTSIQRTDGKAYPDKASIWFDPAQGGMLIVSSLIPAAGTTGVEAGSAQPIFTSYGTATQHTPFARSTFDVGITTAQLAQIIRIGTAKALHVSLASLTDSQVAALWGTSWNDPAAWSLLTANATQEIYNNAATGNANIDGEFYELFVGPKG